MGDRRDIRHDTVRGSEHSSVPASNPYTDNNGEQLERKIKELEDELLMYRQDGMYALYFSLNRKMNELSRSMNNFTLDFTSDDRSFDRFQKVTTSLKEMVDSASWLRNNYMKMTEEEAKEAEKKGIPLIEQLAKQNKK
jgi:hypothetical protein